MSVWLLALGIHIVLSAAEISPAREIALAAAAILSIPVLYLHGVAQRDR